MARTPRFVIPHQPHHVIQRGNDKMPIFQDDGDRLAFLGWLRESARQFKVAIHAYVLMSNHFHLLVTPSDEQGLSRMMQWIGRFYVPYFNRKMARTGTLWQGRFRTSVIESERYFLFCSRYIEMNPVRAGLAGHPSAYKWSSYAHHIGDYPDPLIEAHPLYWAMGNTPFEREAAYRAFVEQGMSQAEAEEISQAVRKGWALGSDAFRLALEKQTQRRAGPGPLGRPAKKQKPMPE